MGHCWTAALIHKDCFVMTLWNLTMTFGRSGTYTLEHQASSFFLKIRHTILRLPNMLMAYLASRSWKIRHSGIGTPSKQFFFFFFLKIRHTSWTTKETAHGISGRHLLKDKESAPGAPKELALGRSINSWKIRILIDQTIASLKIVRMATGIQSNRKTTRSDLTLAQARERISILMSIHRLDPLSG